MSVANLGTREVRQLCCFNLSNSGTQPYQPRFDIKTYILDYEDVE